LPNRAIEHDLSGTKKTRAGACARSTGTSGRRPGSCGPAAPPHRKPTGRSRTRIQYSNSSASCRSIGGPSCRVGWIILNPAVGLARAACLSPPRPRASPCQLSAIPHACRGVLQASRYHQVHPPRHIPHDCRGVLEVARSATPDRIQQPESPHGKRGRSSESRRRFSSANPEVPYRKGVGSTHLPQLNRRALPFTRQVKHVARLKSFITSIVSRLFSGQVRQVIG
jgi:hypothetical protein